jgi:hypothetical protein
MTNLPVCPCRFIPKLFSSAILNLIDLDSFISSESHVLGSHERKVCKLLYIRAKCEDAGIIPQLWDSRVGVASTYIFYDFKK